jgi:ferredoxin-NADP reductase
MTTIAGISGDFILPKSLSSLTEPVNRELVWFGGGIGLAPLLSMLNFLQANRREEDVLFFLRGKLASSFPSSLMPILS